MAISVSNRRSQSTWTLGSNRNTDIGCYAQINAAIPHWALWLPAPSLFLRNGRRVKALTLEPCGLYLDMEAWRCLETKDCGVAVVTGAAGIPV